MQAFISARTTSGLSSPPGITAPKKSAASIAFARVAAAVASVLVASLAFAQAPTRSAETEERIEQQLEGIAPKAVLAFHQATVALDAKDYATAARLYREVLGLAPAFSPALRRLGGALAAAGQVAEGLTFAEAAVQRERSPENLVSLATVLVTPVQGTALPRTTSERALALAKEARTRAGSGVDASYLATEAQIALFAQQYGDFREASRQLDDRFPGEMVTHYFGAIRAALDEDWTRAVREIREAEQLGLPHQDAARFLDSGVGLRANVRRGLEVRRIGAARLGRQLADTVRRRQDAVGRDVEIH